MQWKKILVPTDFSEAASKAYAQACLLADEGAEIHILHRLPAQIPVFSGEDGPSASFAEMGVALDEYVNRMRDDAQRELQELAGAAPSRVSVTTSIEESLEPDEAVLEKARSWPADLIGLGTHGRRGIDRIVMGSVANRVLHHAETDVMLVREDSEIREALEPPKVLVPVDFSDYSHRALAVARYLATRDGGSIHLLHVVQVHRVPFLPGDYSSPLETDPELRTKCDEALRDMLGKSAGDVTVADGKTVSGVALQHREAIGANLVVMGTRGHTALGHILVGSVAEMVARYCEVPVIVVK